MADGNNDAHGLNQRMGKCVSYDTKALYTKPFI
jgi:hypothetical protein